MGNLSKERYRQMSENYEAEQEQLKTEIAVLEELVETRHDLRVIRFLLNRKVPYR